MSGCGKGSADNTFFEWQTDALAAAAANRQLEGDDPASIAVSEPTRVGNYCQISRKTVQTSGTAEAVDFAGRRSSQAYQLAKRAKELKRDMEKMLMDNVARNAGAAGTARVSAGLGAWVGTNYHSLGSGGSPAACAGNGTNTTTAAGSTGAITEAGIKQVIKECFDSGGSPDTILVGSANKQAISALTQSVSPLRTAANAEAPASVIASVSVYVSDFGSFKVSVDRFQRTSDAWFLDFDFWAINYLRPFKTETLSKVGDSVKQMLITEYGLASKNQAASGMLTDLS